MNLDDCYKVIDSISKTELKMLSLSGGEPLLVKDIYKIIDYAKSKGLKIILNSNLTLLDKKNVKNLKKSNVDMVITSLESPMQENHDIIRGKGSFQKTINAIKYCIDEGLYIGINSSVTRTNFKDLENLIIYAQSLGVSFVKFEALIPRGRAVKNYDKLSPTIDEYNEISNKIMDLNDIYFKKIPIIISNVFEIIAEKRKNFCCPSGQLFYTISSEPNICICPSLTNSDNYLNNSNLLIKKMENFDFRKNGNYDKKCMECNYFNVCRSGCFSRSYFKNNNVFSRDPLCELFD